MKHPFAVKSTVIAALVSLASFGQSDSPPSTGSGSSDTRSTTGGGSGSSNKSGSSGSSTRGSTGSGSSGSSSDSTTGAVGQKLNKDDMDFVQEAVAAGRHEVKLSQLAATQATDPSVKELAQQMVSDHQTTNDELREIVTRLGYSLPMDSSSTGSTGSGSSGSSIGSGSSGSLGTGSSGSLGTGSSGSTGSGSSGSSTGGTYGSGSTGSVGSSGSMGSTGSTGSGANSQHSGSTTGSGSSMGSTGGTGTSSGELGTADDNDVTGGSARDRYGSTTGSGASGSVGSSGASGSVGSGSSGASGSLGSSGASARVGSTSANVGSSGTSITISPSMQKKYDDKYNEISKLTGSKFDKAYLSALIDSHKKVIKLFEKESKSGNDSELKSFATRTLPTLQQHLDRTQSIEKDVKGRRF